jgi:acetyl-CoA acetyltransferase
MTDVVIHTEPADAYMVRVVGIKAGLPKEVPAYTVNRLCGTVCIGGGQGIALLLGRG